MGRIPPRRLETYRVPFELFEAGTAMNLLKNLRIHARLTVGFLAVFLLVGAAAAVGAWKLASIGQVVDRLVDDDAAKLAIAQRWEKGIAVNLVRTHTLFLLEDRELSGDLRRDIEATSAEISANQKALEDSITNDEDRAAIAAIGDARAKYRAEREKMMKRKAAGESVREELSQSLEPVARAYLASVHSFVELQERDLRNAKEAAELAVSRARAIVLGLIALGFVVAVLAAAFIARSITGPVARARASALRIAEGDLSESLSATGHDEISEMVVALGSMQASLRDIAGKVRSSADAVSVAASQIATGNTDLSARTEEQASSLQETAASIEEMTATVNQNANNAAEANQVANSAAGVARRGGDAVDQVVKMMESIQSSSRKIGDITGVIDSIAFQTNLLALNAAVEAARAGDQGRGFAVVAGEVRTLAQRSAEAAKQIKSLITDSVGRVDQGARLADDAGKTMNDVVESVSRVSQIIGEMAAATREQSTGIAQVNTAVGDLDKVTQHNASLAEQSTAASESLRHLASEMVEVVSVFRLADHDAPAVVARKPTLARPASLAKLRLGVAD